MKKILACISVAVCIIAVSGFVKFDDDDTLKKIVIQLQKWTTDNPQEKVYLHLDKPYYAIGEDIWFKAYVTIGSGHQLSALSGILNVELIDDNDSVKRALKVPLNAGLGWGNINLTDTLPEGNYRIRAYTNYMRNAGDEYFFDKTIQVGKSISGTVFTNVNYTYSNLPDNKQKVGAVISYSNADGKPYANADVSYNVQQGTKFVAKGKGVTNEQGELALTFVNPVSCTISSGHIITDIKLSSQNKTTKVIPFITAAGKTDVQFFPEGGTLVSNIKCRVAFKAVAPSGLGAEIKGTIVDDQNEEVAQINTQHLGMGTFTFIPQPGKNYTAKVTYPDGAKGAVPLPKVADDGYVLSVNNADPDNIVVKVSAGAVAYQRDQGTDIIVVAQSDGNVIFSARNKLEAPVFVAKIPKSRFPSGIAQFTLFSATSKPLNERIAFIQNDDLLKLSLNPSKASYASREKVKINIAAKNQNNQPVVGSFSIAVVDENKVKVDESEESTILSNILLTSDLKGYIEKPNYYFTNVNDKTKADLDVLMLTQGYRRFEWVKILADQFTPRVFMPEHSIQVAGHLKTSGGKPVAFGSVTLLSTKGNTFLLDTVTDKDGAFVFNNLVFYDSLKFVLQARNVKNQLDVSITLDNVPPQFVAKNKNLPDVEVNVNASMPDYLQSSKSEYDELLRYGVIKKTRVLKTVNIKDKKTPLKYSSNLNGPGNADQVITAIQLSMGCPTLIDCLEGKLIGIVFDQYGRPYSTRSQHSSFKLNTYMSVYIDGILSQESSLAHMDPNDVESIEILKSAGYTAIYGVHGATGVMLITLKHGGSPEDTSPRYAPGVLNCVMNGYYQARLFYSPQYDDPKTNPNIADLRTTIFWKPNILTDKDGNAIIEFFSADAKGTYKAIIEGIDNDGNIGRQVVRFKVE